MSRTPTKTKQLTRQRSLPSIDIGIPPPIPSYILPMTSPQHLKRSKSRPVVHHGDVSSSTESAGETDAESDPFIAQSTPGQSNSAQSTPKRRVGGIMETTTVGRPKAGLKRETLQSRLQAASIVRTSRSMDTLHAIPPVPALSSFTLSPMRDHQATSSSSVALQKSLEKPKGSRSDKVIVCVRIKPTTSTFASTAYETTPSSIALADSHPNVIKRGGKAGREDEYTYTFDKLLQHPSKTSELYDAKIAPLIEKAMLGFNTTVFAYGATASGKSHTMTGTAEELGIIPCAVDGVFDAINAETDREYLLRVSYLEIYNETIRDLLNFKKGPLKDEDKPFIHTDKGKVYVHPLSESIVSTPQDVMELLERGNALRKVGVTDWNERSSRSHSVFTITVESRPREGDSEDDIRLSRLNLIDLAGSEKAAADVDRRGEGKYINQSLLALREVINKLTEKRRNSKLTHMLENALGGDSNICVICTVSAEESHHSETLETLKFAGRCSQVETRARKNILLSNDRALIRAKDLEIQELRQELQAIRSPESSVVDSLSESVAMMEERKAKLVTQLSKLNAEILTSESVPGSNNDGLSPRPKRRRISDFNTMGLGTPKKGHDRRTVSNMVRVVEENETQEPQTGLSNDIIAALRRSLSVKEEELVSANRELSVAIAQLALLPERETEIRFLQTEIKGLRDKTHHEAATFAETRTALLETIQQKSNLVDELEQKILDLRQSREDLAIEDSLQLESAQSKADAASRELEEVKQNSATQLAEVRHEHAVSTEQLQKVANEAQEAVDRSLEEIARLKAQHTHEISSITNNGQLALEKLRLELSNEFARSKQRLEEECTGLRENLTRSQENERNSREELERFQKAAMENETAVIEALKSQLCRCREKLEETEARVTTAISQLAEENAEKLRVAAALEEEKQKLRSITVSLQREEEDYKARDAVASAEIDRSRREVADTKHEHAMLLDRVRLLEEKEIAANGALSSQQLRVAELAIQLTEAKEAMERDELELRKRITTIEAERDEALAQARDTSSLLADLQARFEHNQGDLAERLAQTEATEQELRSQIVSLESDLNDSKQREEALNQAQRLVHIREGQIRAEIGRLKQETDAIILEERKRTNEALQTTEHNQSRLGSMQARLSDYETKATDSAEELASLRAKYEALQASHARCGADLNLKETAAQEQLAANAKLVRDLKKDKADLQKTIEKLQLDKSKKDADDISKDRKREVDLTEIERLEKVVEEQNLIIEDQKARIKFWAKELEQQREIVRALTLNPGSPGSSEDPKGNLQAKPAPTHGSPAHKSSGSQGRIASTFTAFNLAMPSAPTPLPMHASQFDNSSGRKGRRLTIEHDIGLLSDSSKVNRVRAVFDRPIDDGTPSKVPSHKRSGSALGGCVPKQRRP